MRRRGRHVEYGARYGRAGDGKTDGYAEPRLMISEVPEAWRKHAREPWRIVFPDLDWRPPDEQ
jgi:hypothetical protein